MDKDDKLIITADEAESLLPAGDSIHNFINPSVNMFVGCDYSRDDTITALKKAIQIEIAGENCKRMKHALAVWDSKTHVSFFEADMDKVEAFEVARLKARLKD